MQTKSLHPLQILRELRTASPSVKGWSAGILVLFNALPYLGRLPRGLDWVAGILPDGSGLFFIVGLLFFQVIYSLPVLPLARRLLQDRRPTWYWFLTLGIVSLLVGFSMKDVDLCCDPNAAVALPSIAMFATGLAYVLLMIGARFSPEVPDERTDEEKLKAALKKAADSPGWLGRDDRWKG